ncbi:hypothetical protein IU469_22005 [Nocardia puris]|uniref:hypothetical protein n=1 Tax=Nocardia puris TaxID=208602 RepID=UPI00189471F3|nr:hypothetical protein [Nocardia puris]MBF6368373.1 hypothetical protein [Nocardia puris]
MLKPKNTVAALAIAAFAVLGGTACEPVEGKPVPSTTTGIDAPGLWIAPTSTLPVAPAKLDPLKSSGTWLVPSEIPVGTYRVTATSSWGGYWATCADLACDIDFDGSDYTGLIDNELVELDAPGYLVIPPHAVAVELRDVELEPIG